MLIALEEYSKISHSVFYWFLSTLLIMLPIIKRDFCFVACEVR